MLPSIAHEAHVLRELHNEGWAGSADTLRTLAAYGSQLRQRYERSCSYPWANTSLYLERTESIERACVRYAVANGLNIYLQTDPRGATVYVRDRTKPVDGTNYNSVAQCVYQ